MSAFGKASEIGARKTSAVAAIVANSSGIDVGINSVGKKQNLVTNGVEKIKSGASSDDGGDSTGVSISSSRSGKEIIDGNISSDGNRIDIVDGSLQSVGQFDDSHGHKNGHMMPVMMQVVLLILLSLAFLV